MTIITKENFFVNSYFFYNLIKKENVKIFMYDNCHHLISKTSYTKVKQKKGGICLKKKIATTIIGIIIIVAMAITYTELKHFFNCKTLQTTIKWLFFCQIFIFNIAYVVIRCYNCFTR